MNQLEDMRIFAETVDAQSFTGAADRLGLSKQFVSKRIAALEKRLGVPLLMRSTRQLRVTDLGLAYYERTQRILREVDAAEQMVASQTATPRGVLRLSVPMTLFLIASQGYRSIIGTCLCAAAWKTTSGP